MIKLSILLLLAVVLTSNTEKAKKPNIILIMTDDQGWFDVGFNGNTEIQTPWLDSLANDGVIFNRFYSASAVCSPTRASLITGRNPLRMGIAYANVGHMKEAEITIAELLKKEDYATGHFGKWHLGTLTKTELDANRGGKDKFIQDYSIPSQHGYDEYFCSESKVPTYNPMIKPTKFDDGEGLRFGWKATGESDSTTSFGTAYWTGPQEKAIDNLYGDDSRIIMDRVLPFIEKARDNLQPFFSTIWFHTPHLPVVSDSIHRSIYSSMNLKEQIYFGTITAMDEQIGRLWKKLDALGISDETIIFFCSDNGPENGTPGSAGVFRGRKRSLYEGGVRVPAFVIWKNNLDGGKRIDYPMVTSDYMPTILDLLNINYPDHRPLDGTSILGAMNGEATIRKKAIGFISEPHKSWVSDRYKLLQNKADEDFELYDLLNDQSEKHNIADKHPEIVIKLKSELFEWLRSVENSSKEGDY